jgi:uncharacterized protein (TIGR00730 family)
MDDLARGARDAGGKVIGIVPRLFVEKGLSDGQCDELVVVDDLRQRKTLMETRGDAFIALPGGLGTLEELFEILVGRYLGTHAKPIVLVNIAGFYDPLWAMLERGIEQGFIKPAVRRLCRLANTPAEAIEALGLSDARPSSLPRGLDDESGYNG